MEGMSLFVELLKTFVIVILLTIIIVFGIFVSKFFDWIVSKTGDK